jgi:hypothetical protein
MESHSFVVRPRRPRRWFWPTILVVLLVLIAAGPTIITKTSLLDRAISWSVPSLDGRFAHGNVRVSWFSPIEVENITVLDLDDQVLLSAEQVTTEHSLLRLITRGRQLGLIRIVSPRCTLRLTETSSNLEDFLATLGTDEGGDPSGRDSTGFRLQIEDGLITIKDQVTSSSWQFSQLMLKCDVPTNDAQPLTGAVSADSTDGSTTGKLFAQFQLSLPQDNALGDSPPQGNRLQPFGAGHLELETDQFPLDILNVALRRSQTQGHIAGYCETRLDCQWGDVHGQVTASASGSIQATSSRISLPDYFGTDQITLASANAILDGGIENNVITVRSLNLTTDHGSVNFSGAAPLAEITGTGLVATLLSSKTQNHYEFAGQLDLAGLFASLPSTLCVRDGTSVTSGNLQFNLTSDLQAGQRQLQGTLDANDLAATRNGQGFQWQQPVQINFAGVATDRGLVIEQARCDSDFLTAQAAGQLDQGSLRATADLSRLAAELEQFFDLQGKQFSGKMNATVDWQRVNPSNVQCDARLELSDFTFVTAEQQAWTEHLLTIVGAATLTVDNYDVRGVHSGEVTITSDTDELSVTLTHAVSEFASLALPLNITLAGDMQNWLTRARPWYQPESWTLAGSVEAEVKGSFSPQLVALEQAQANVRDFEFTHPSLHVVESVAQFQGVASWDAQMGQLSSPWFTLTGTTVALRAENVEVRSGEAITASGEAAFRGDVARLYKWFQDPTQPRTARTRGMAEGQLQARTQGEAVAFRLNSTVRDFAYEQTGAADAMVSSPPADAWNTVWQEPALQVITDGQYDATADQVALENVQLVGESVQVDATGKLTALSASPQVDLTGQLSYDLQRIMAQLNLGQVIQLHGRQNHPFAIRGPLSTAEVQVDQPVAGAATSPGSPPVAGKDQPLIPPDLTARATFGWEDASFYGMPVGPGQFTAQLSQGVVVASPLDLKFGPGQIRVAPTLHLNTNPMMVVLEQAPLAQAVEISPQMCASWLKYVTPLLANATTARGRFSVDLAGAQIPLTEPMAASAGGRLTIHEARIQPGPLASQIVAVTDQVTQLIGEKNRRLTFLQDDQSWMDIRENSVDFQMIQGRVYHRNLNVNVGKVQVRTEGWVGLDQTMSMVATIPILDDWIDGEPLLAGLQGRELAIPVQGTFDQPMVDQQALAQFSRQMVCGAAQHYLQGELQKGLQKLLKGR